MFPWLSVSRRSLVAQLGIELRLANDDLRQIEDALPEAQGERYSEANQRMIDC